MVVAMARFLLSTYRREWPELSDEEISGRLHEYNQKRLNSLPDTGKYPELRGIRELVEAEWRGTRDGAALNPAEWAASCDNLYYYQHFLQSENAAVQGCTYVFFPDSDRGPILANNLDTTPDEPFGEPEWVMLNEHLFWGGVSCGIWYDETPEEIFPVPIDRLVARYCRSTDEAVELLTRYKGCWGMGNSLLVDGNRRAAMVEKSTNRIGVRYSEDGFSFITAMAMAEDGMRDYLADRRRFSLRRRGLPDECCDTAYWAEADRRHELLEELLDEARQEPTLEKLRQIIQFRDPERGRVCYNGEALVPGGEPVEHTIRTVIWLLAEGKAMWWAREGEVPSYENRMPDVEYGDAQAWEQGASG